MKTTGPLVDMAPVGGRPMIAVNPQPPVGSRFAMTDGIDPSCDVPTE